MRLPQTVAKRPCTKPASELPKLEDKGVSSQEDSGTIKMKHWDLVSRLTTSLQETNC